MRAFRAIVADTWRQSRQQGVFLLMLAVMLAVVVLAVAWPDPMRPRLTIRALGTRAMNTTILAPEVEAPRGLVAADLDGDGEHDLALLSAAGLQIWRGAAGWLPDAPSATLPVEGSWLGLQALPLRGGGSALALFGEAGVALYRLEGESLRALGEGCPGPVVDLAVADLDADGDSDLVCAGPAARVWLNAGAGAFEAGSTLGELQLVTAGDLEGDGGFDVIGARGQEVLGWRVVGQGLEAPEVLARAAGPIWDLAAARLLRAGQPAVILASGLRGVESFVHGEGGWTAQQTRAGKMSPEVDRILVVDFDGDGTEDLGMFSKNPGRSALWATSPDRLSPVFGTVVQLSEEVRGLSAVYRAAGERDPRIVGLEGFEGIDIPLYEPGNVALFGGEDESWRALYAESLLTFKAEGADGKRLDMRQVLERTAAASQTRTSLERHAELLALKAGKVLYTLSLILFIGACAGYFPGLLAEGGVDMVLARPVSRLQIYLAKFCGGLLLYSLAACAASLALVVAIGLRFGAYPWVVLSMVPFQVFTAAVLFAILGAIGVLTRSTALPLMFGLFFYLAVDTGLGLLMQYQAAEKVFGDGPLGKSIEWATLFLPNFDQLKLAGQAAAFQLNALTLRPVLTSGAWLIVFLSLGFARFRSGDY